MTRNEIIEMAQEIAAQYSKAERFQTWTHDYMMQRLMELVAAEREALCKAMEDQIGWDMYDPAATAIQVIRARGNT